MPRTTQEPVRRNSSAATRAIVTITGVQPTGDLHLGNYVGAIRPLAELAADTNRDVYVFVADLHALNARPDPSALRERSQRLAAALLASGLDRQNVHLYRQSRVTAVAQLAALLGNVTAKGVLNRAHAYKASVASNVAAGRDPDHGVNMGLYGYPLLMAADILALDTDEVPVGADQAQHLEIAVDLAHQFARTYRPDVLYQPRPLIGERTASLPGIDGRKMSKSYGNTIELMAAPDVMHKQIRRIVTDSTPPEQPKDPETCTLVALLRAFADLRTVADVERRYPGAGSATTKSRGSSPVSSKHASRRCATATSDCSPTLRHSNGGSSAASSGLADGPTGYSPGRWKPWDCSRRCIRPRVDRASDSPGMRAFQAARSAARVSAWTTGGVPSAASRRLLSHVRNILAARQGYEWLLLSRRARAIEFGAREYRRSRLRDRKQSHPGIASRFGRANLPAACG